MNKQLSKASLAERLGRFSFVMLIAILITLVSCKDNPSDPPLDVAEVDGYLQELPSWTEFSPPKAPVDPTATGEAVEEEEVTMDVEKVDENGDVYTEENVVYACQDQPFTMTQNPEQIAMYSPDREILWAGALIQGKSHRDGLGSLLGLPIQERAPIRVSIPGLANDDNFRTVDNPNQAEVDQAVGSMIGGATQSGLSTPSTISFSMETYYSEQQSALQMGISGRYLGFEASASGSIDRKRSEKTVTAQFYQKMYEVVVEPPQSPGAFFSDDFTEEKLQQQVDLGRIGPNNLPVYVSNIVYGRMMMFSLTSTATEEEIRATMQAGYESIGGGGSVNLSAKEKGILRESKIKVTSIGGDAEATLSIIRSGDWSQYFTNSVPLSSASPLSYTFRNLGDGSIASVSETTEYNLRTCTARQASPGTFDLLNHEDLNLPISTPASSTVADVNGDGNDDLVWNHLGSDNEVAIALSNGDGTFASPSSFTHPETAPEGWGKYTLVTGDFNDDNQTDLLWNYDGTQNRLYVALATGGGSFDMLPDTTHPSMSWGEGYAKLIGDVDGDGDDDIVWNARYSTNRTYVGFSNGDGTFDMESTPQDHYATGWGGYDVFLGDVNNDGKADIIWNVTASTHNRTYVGLFQGTTPGNWFNLLSFQDRSAPGWADYTTMIGNVDGTDGQDLVFVALTRDSNWPEEDAAKKIPIHRNISRGDGRFDMPGWQALPVTINGSEKTLMYRLADVNADGKDDIIFYNQTDDITRVGLGTEDGTFDFNRVHQERDPTLDDWSTFRVLTGDFNGDNYQDIIWNDAASRNRVYVGLARSDSQ